MTAKMTDQQIELYRVGQLRARKFHGYTMAKLLRELHEEKLYDEHTKQRAPMLQYIRVGGHQTFPEARNSWPKEARKTLNLADRTGRMRVVLHDGQGTEKNSIFLEKHDGYLAYNVVTSDAGLLGRAVEAMRRYSRK